MGSYHGCAIDTQGALLCWGMDSSGQGSDAPEGSFIDVACGEEHCLAVDTEGEMVCWGGSVEVGQCEGP